MTVVRLQMSDRTRSVAEGDVLERNDVDLPIPMDITVSLASLRKQIQRLTYSQDPIGAKRSTLGVLIHGIPLTLLEITALTVHDTAEVQRDLGVLLTLGIIEEQSDPSGERTYRVILPEDEESVQKTASLRSAKSSRTGSDQQGS